MIHGVNDNVQQECSLTFVNHHRILIHVEERLPVGKFIGFKSYRQSIFIVFGYIGKTVFAVIPVNDLPNRMKAV